MLVSTTIFASVIVPGDRSTETPLRFSILQLSPAAHSTADSLRLMSSGSKLATLSPSTML